MAMAYKSSLTEPLLKDDKTDETQHDIDNIKNAIKESAKLKEDLDADPSYEPLQVKPKLEYEPESLDVPMIIAEQHPEEIQFTSNKSVWQTCPYCNTTAETTTVSVCGTITCLWFGVLLVLCFPLCWIPLVCKNVS